MTSRRSFFRSLIGLVIAPKVVEALPVQSIEPTRRMAINWTIEAEQHLMYMHGINIDAELMRAMSRDIQNEIDSHMITKLSGELV
jgi:hypothetical protein